MISRYYCVIQRLDVVLLPRRQLEQGRNEMLTRKNPAKQKDERSKKMAGRKRKYSGIKWLALLKES